MAHKVRATPMAHKVRAPPTVAHKVRVAPTAIMELGTPMVGSAEFSQAPTRLLLMARRLAKEWAGKLWGRTHTVFRRRLEGWAVSRKARRLAATGLSPAAAMVAMERNPTVLWISSRVTAHVWAIPFSPRSRLASAGCMAEASARISSIPTIVSVVCRISAALCPATPRASRGGWVVSSPLETGSAGSTLRFRLVSGREGSGATALGDMAATSTDATRSPTPTAGLAQTVQACSRVTTSTHSSWSE
mmetsp:Transcript_65671/g.155144  ORF Transcript_65671/g.155144 Transcript_65671/m.155144 type:complete len:246 (+) Transcript_65671:3-740(+)